MVEKKVPSTTNTTCRTSCSIRLAAFDPACYNPPAISNSRSEDSCWWSLASPHPSRKKLNHHDYFSQHIGRWGTWRSSFLSQNPSHHTFESTVTCVLDRHVGWTGTWRCLFYGQASTWFKGLQIAANTNKKNWWVFRPFWDIGLLESNGCIDVNRSHALRGKKNDFSSGWLLGSKSGKIPSQTRVLFQDRKVYLGGTDQHALSGASFFHWNPRSGGREILCRRLEGVSLDAFRYLNSHIRAPLSLAFVFCFFRYLSFRVG